MRWVRVDAWSGVQVGAAEYVPRHILQPDQERARLANGLMVERFDYRPSLAALMASAALIISHAGSGSVFEALRLRVPLIAVPNAILMANHQVCSTLTGAPLLLSGITSLIMCS